MKIIQFINALGGGGAEVFTAQLSVALSKMDGVEVYLVTYAGLLDKKGEYLRDYVTSNGVHYINLDIHGKYSRLYKPFLEMRKVIKNIKPDVIHSHLQPADIYVGLLSLIMRTFKNVRTLHNARNTKFVPKILEPTFFSLFDYNIGCASFVGREYPVLKLRNKIIGIDNGVDMELLTQESSVTTKEEIRKDLGIPADATVFINIGSMYLTNGHSNKNQELIIDAFSLLDRKISWFLIFVGNGPLLADLKMRASKLRIQDRILFTGLVPSPSKYILASDFSVMPSFKEGLPISLIECVSNGLPTILSDIPAFDPFRLDSSIFLKTFKSQELSTVLEDAIENKSKYEFLGKKNIKRYIDQFDMKQVAAKYLKLYKD